MKRVIIWLMALMLMSVMTGCTDRFDINIFDHESSQVTIQGETIIFEDESAKNNETGIEPTPLVDIPDDYNLQDAKREKSVVYEDGDITVGQDVWDMFVSATENETPTVVRLVFYYSEDHLDDASIYPMDLTYTGEGYRLEHYEEGELLVDEFPYMVKYVGQPNPEAIFSDYTYYVLVEDKTVTWGMIQKGVFSSQMGDYIPHRRVYSDIVLKGESTEVDSEPE